VQQEEHADPGDNQAGNQSCGCVSDLVAIVARHVFSLLRAEWKFPRESANSGPLPVNGGSDFAYNSNMTAITQTERKDLSLRHTLATLAYRAAKVLRDTPPDFSGFQAGAGTRTPGQILAHLCDLFDWALSQARGAEEWHDTQPRSWDE